jgi:hypothetical protein
VKSIAYKFLYMFAGMQLLFALALALTRNADAWMYFGFAVCAYYIADAIDRGTKASPR